ncbi:MAG: hypothetical protein M3156_06940 [Thermoproteota archaeon]|nr:hypothetical protein [Thermoproteota archaeon]
MSILQITYLTDQNIITIKEDVYSVLHLGMKMKFREEKYRIEDWKYANRKTGQLYRLYTLQDLCEYYHLTYPKLSS